MEELDLTELQDLVLDGVSFDDEVSLEDQVIEEDTTEEVETDEKVSEEEEDVKDTEDTKDSKEEEVAPEGDSNPQEVTESYYALKALIDAGEMEDLIVEIGGEEVQLSEFKNIDSDTLKDVISSYKNSLKEEEEGNYVSVKDLDEKKKALIDIIIKGDVDEVQELLKEPALLKDPFEGFDNSNQEHNIKVYMAYLTNVKGHSPDEAEVLTEVAIKNNTLDEKSLKIVETHRENTKKAILEERERVQKLEAEKKERIKNYAKKLDETYKAYNLKPEKVLELKKLATQFNKVGNLPIDEIYDTKMQNPEDAADLILFLTDRELYDKRVYAKAKKESDIQSLKKIQIISSSKKKATSAEDVTKALENSSLSEFENIIIED